MALKECAKCGALVTDTTPVCPNCGRKKRPPCQQRWELVLTVLVFAGAVAWLWFSQQPNRQHVAGQTRQQITGHQSEIINHEQDMQVMEDRYRYFQIQLKSDAEITVQFTVKSGPDIDVFFLHNQSFSLWKENFNRFEAQEVDYIEELSSFGTTQNTSTHRLEAGIYYVVFDNTGYGPTSPPDDFHNDIVTMDVLITKN